MALAKGSAIEIERDYAKQTSTYWRRGCDGKDYYVTVRTLCRMWVVTKIKGLVS